MIEELNGDFLQWLRGFYYIARTGSVRKAAEMMRRNPSTISYQLRCLENELNVVLFDRQKKSLRITPEGRKLLDWAISAFETLQNMRASVGNIKGELQGSIRMAATFPALLLATEVIGEFTKLYPKVDITIERVLSLDARKAVEDSMVDFGILPVIRRPEEGNFELVLKARPLIVMHRDDPWNVPDLPELSDLEHLPYVAFCDKYDNDDFNVYIHNSGLGDFINRNSVLKINNYHLIVRFVWQKLGVCIIDELCFLGSRRWSEWGDLKTVPIDHILPNRVYGILTRKNKHISPPTQKLIEMLRDHYRSLPSLDRTLELSEIGAAPMSSKKRPAKAPANKISKLIAGEN